MSMTWMTKNYHIEPNKLYLKKNYHLGGVADPFTGAGAYSTQPMDIDLDQDASEYFPQKTYLQFAQVR